MRVLSTTSRAGSRDGPGLRSPATSILLALCAAAVSYAGSCSSSPMGSGDGGGGGGGVTALNGVVFDTNGVTPLEGMHYTISPVGGGTGANGTTDAQGKYGAELEPGRYAVFSVGVQGFRWVMTPGDTADVVRNQRTIKNLNVRRGYHLEAMTTNLNLQANAGATVTFTLDFRVWNRDLCPGCVPSVAIGVDGTALTVLRFAIPGIYPGTIRSQAVTFTAPAVGGDLYAMLYTGSTGASIQPGLDAYEAAWANNLSRTLFIPIGQLVIN